VLKFIAQLVSIIVLSVGVLWLIPIGIYATIGALVGIVLLVLLLTRGRWASDDEISENDLEGHELHLYALEFFWRFVLALMLGAIWPSLPVIIGGGRARDRSKADQVLYERR
jgi:hypothetical protein